MRNLFVYIGLNSACSEVNAYVGGRFADAILQRMLLHAHQYMYMWIVVEITSCGLFAVCKMSDNLILNYDIRTLLRN